MVSSVGNGSEHRANHFAIMDPSGSNGANSDDHQYSAYVTAPKQYKALTFKQMELIHALLGLTSEVGEIADAIKKHVIYDQPLDTNNLVEEVGDVDWYAGLLLTAINELRSVAMEKNISKLKKRYPEGFTALAAAARADKLPPNTTACPTCQGQGRIGDFGDADCIACAGKGYVPTNRGNPTNRCQDCEGAGRVTVRDGGPPFLEANRGHSVSIICAKCGGTGRNR